MCGVFGFTGVGGTPEDNPSVQDAVRSLVALSEPRGREATGVALWLPDEIAVFRRPMAPSKVLAHPDFRQFLDAALPPSDRSFDTHGLAMLGHCRLVTNGTQALESNNQPVCNDRVVGVHNGIVTNPAELAGAGRLDGAPPLGELDSAALFRRMSHELEDRGDTGAAVGATFTDLLGEASIAMFARDEGELVLATNAGNLYFAHAPESKRFVFASESHILRSFLRGSALVPAGTPVRHLAAGRAVRVILATGDLIERRITTTAPTAGSIGVADQTTVEPAKPLTSPPPRRPVVNRTHPEAALRRCARCILPETYPFIAFDAAGVCNFCHDHITQKVAGRDALMRELDRHRRSDGTPDCIVAFSGGRDSSYGLHLLKTELGMTPLAFTYDWGLVTDLARRNQARLCGKLGIEHVIRAANIPAQRRYIRANIAAWLRRPRLGMIPIFMAGDKFFYSHARDLRKETGIDLVVFCAGNELERTPFKAGFAGVKENNYSNRLFGLAATKKAQLAAYYGLQFLANPRYFNESLVNSIRSFFTTFVGVDDFLYLFTYEPWDEATIDRTLQTRYDWETSPESNNTWRIGDGYTAFINYIYNRVAGFSEFDAFRSHQVRDRVIDRETALALVAEDNRPRLSELREFARLIGFNLEDVLSQIDAIPRVRPRA